MSHVSGSMSPLRQDAEGLPSSLTRLARGFGTAAPSLSTDAKEKKRLQNRVAQRGYRMEIFASFLFSEQRDLEAKDGEDSGQMHYSGRSRSTPSSNEQEQHHYPALPNETAVINAQFNCLPGQKLGDAQQPVANGLHNAATSTSVNQFTAGQPDCLDLFLSASTETWKPDQFSELIPHSQKPLGLVGLEMQSSSATSLAGRGVSAHPPSTTESESLIMPDGNSSLNERFECIMECLGATGFENFDALVTSYYRDAFQEASQLSHEQRLSRHRRLPKVIADVFEAAQLWKTHERQGLCDEILKSAESMLISENSPASIAVGPLTDALLSRSSQDGKDAAATHRAIQDLRTIIPNEQPNLWGLLMALAASNGPMWRRDCSSTVLSAIFLLRYAGRLPKHVILEVIDECL